MNLMVTDHSHHRSLDHNTVGMGDVVEVVVVEDTIIIMIRAEEVPVGEVSEVVEVVQVTVVEEVEADTNNIKIIIKVEVEVTMAVVVVEGGINPNIFKNR